MPPKPIDQVQATLQRIAEWANITGVPIVTGEPGNGTPIPTIFIETSGDLLDACAALSPKLLITRTEILTEAALELALDEARQDGDRQRVAALEALRPRIGHISFLGVWVLTPGYPLLAYTTAPAWYTALSEDEESEEVNEAGETTFQREHRERRYWTVARRTGAAKQAASDPRFPQAKTEAARVLIVRGVLGEKAPESDYIIKEIAREARALFDLSKAQRQRDG